MSDDQNIHIEQGMDWTPFPVLFEDDDFIAINKPPGILVHRTGISEDRVFVLQLLRDQIGLHIYPIHRLDRGTTGVLLFAKRKEAASKLSQQMRVHSIAKSYLAIVRGWLPEPEATIDYALKKMEKEERQSAVTHYQRLATSEVPIQIGRYPSSRFSYARAQLETGRWHQIRRHFSHLRHPVIGDKPHGDVKHNRFFKEEWGIKRMLLHGESFTFLHPFTEEEVVIKAELDESFLRALELTGLVE